MPQAQVERVELWQFHDPLESNGRDPRAAVQVDALQLLHTISDHLQTLIRNPRTLADVQRLQLRQVLRYPADPLVADLTRRKGQRFQQKQSLRNVHQRLIADLLAKRHVQGRNFTSTFRQVRHANIRNIVARAQVQFPQISHLGQVFQSRISNTNAKRQVDALQVAKPRGNVPKRLVT